MAESLSVEALQYLFRQAGLDLPPERVQELAPSVVEFLDRLKRLDELDLKDVAPAFISPLMWK
ncbi:MAG: hypothetical protein HYU29_04790 [Chloroflexi bacterium]|nr:hypothetical protein [Chloroflexota bacterium]